MQPNDEIAVLKLRSDADPVEILTSDQVKKFKKLAQRHSVLEQAIVTIEALQAKCGTLEKSQERSHDLLRYCRHKLHDEDLISDEEYTELLLIPGAVARLGGYDEIRAKVAALEKERDVLKTDTARLDWLEANWLARVDWIKPMDSCDGEPLWSTQSRPNVGGFQEEITDTLRRAIDLHRECHLEASCPK